MYMLSSDNTPPRKAKVQGRGGRTDPDRSIPSSTSPMPGQAPGVQTKPEPLPRSQAVPEGSPSPRRNIPAAETIPACSG